MPRHARITTVLPLPCVQSSCKYSQDSNGRSTYEQTLPCRYAHFRFPERAKKILSQATTRMLSVDTISSKLQNPKDRQNILSLFVLFNLVMGIAFIISTFFVSGTFGAGLGFQATSTALANLAVSYACHQWLKHPDMQRIDMLGGVYVMTVLMLLQTCAAWSALSQGFVGTNACVVPGNGGDHATSVFAGFLFASNAAVGAMAYAWRKDFTEDLHAGIGYSHISTRPDTNAPLAGGGNEPKDAFLDEEGGL